LPHEYLLFPDEGHGMAKPQNREVFYARAEAFLAEHLGGRVQEAAPGGDAGADGGSSAGGVPVDPASAAAQAR
jgi:hypothetical protein